MGNKSHKLLIISYKWKRKTTATEEEQKNGDIICVKIVIYLKIQKNRTDQHTTMSTQRSNAKTISVQSILCVDDGGGSIGNVEFVAYVEFMISNESFIVLVAAKMVDFSEKFPIRRNARVSISVTRCSVAQTVAQIFPWIYLSLSFTLLHRHTYTYTHKMCVFCCSVIQ